MKLYIFKIVKYEVINVEFLSKDLDKVHWNINPPLKKTTLSFLPSLPPSSNLQTFQISFFSHPPLLYWFFVNLSPLKIGFFSETP